MAEAEQIEVQINRHPAGLVVRPVGDVDLSRSPSFRGELKKVLDEGPGRLVIDLSSVPYMDSSGVATLVECLQIARRGSIPLVLCAMQTKVRSVFEIARLDSVFTISESVETALEA